MAAPKMSAFRRVRLWRVVDAVIEGAMGAGGRGEAERDRRAAMNRLEELVRPVALVLGGKEALPAALPGDVDATGAGVELALFCRAVGQELPIADLVAAPDQHVPAMRGRRPQLDADRLALDHLERLGGGRHADGIGDDPARRHEQGQNRHGEWAAHVAPSP